MDVVRPVLRALRPVGHAWATPTSGRVGPITEFELDKTTHLYIVDSIISGNWNALGDALEHLILPSVTLGLLVSGGLYAAFAPASADQTQSEMGSVEEGRKLFLVGCAFCHGANGEPGRWPGGQLLLRRRPGGTHL